MKRIFSLALGALATLAGLTLQASELSAQKAGVYCAEATGCGNVVAALKGSFPGGVDMVFNGTSGTVDIRTVDMKQYAVFFIPSLADNGARQPYALLRDATVAAKLSSVLTGRVAVWSGTPDQGKANRDSKDALIRNLAQYAAAEYATTKAPGLVVLQDASATMSSRYNWVPGISGRSAFGVSPAAKAFGRVRALTDVGSRVVGNLAYGNMASFGFVIADGSGWSADVDGSEVLSFGGMTPAGTLGASGAGVAKLVNMVKAWMFSSGAPLLITSSGPGAKVGVIVVGDQSPNPVNPGGPAAYDIDVYRCVENSCNGNPTLYYSIHQYTTNLPAGYTAWPTTGTSFSFSKQALSFGPKNKTVRSTLTISTSAGMAAGTYGFDAVVCGKALYDPTKSLSSQDCGVQRGILRVVVPVTTNGTPVVTKPSNQSSLEGATVSLQIRATDPEGTALTYGASNLPPGLTINTSTGLISGTVDYLADRSYTVTVTASDGNSSGSETFTWTIGDVNRQPVVAATNASVSVMEGQTASNSGTCSDPDGDAVTLSASPGTISGSCASGWTWSHTTAIGDQSGTVTITATDAGGLTATTSFSLTVTARPATTVSVSPATATYGDNSVTLNATVTAGSTVNGGTVTFTVTGSPTVGSATTSGTVSNGSASASYSLPAGTAARDYTITAVYSGSSNLSGNSGTGTLTITARPITVTADAQSKVYGEANPALTYQVTAGSLVTGDVFTGSLSRATGENVGPYAIGQNTLTAGSNYNITFVPANFTITAKTLTVTATADTKVFGAADPTAFAFTNSESLAATAFTGSLSRATGENVGPYAIGQNTLTAGSNYNITFVPANFTITAKALTVTPTSGLSKVFGGTDPALTFTHDGPADLALEGSLKRATGENVGPYAISNDNLSAGSNYQLSLAATVVNFTITEATPTVSWNPNPSTIDQGTSLAGLLNASATGVGGVALTGGTFTYRNAQNQVVTASTVLNTVAPHAFTVTYTPADANYNRNGTATATITVGNVAPVVTITGPASGAVFAKDAQVTFTGTFTDPGATDTHTYEWLFKSRDHEHKVSATAVVPAPGGRSVSSTFSFPNAGVYNVTLTVRDNNSGVGTATIVGNNPDALATVVIYDPSAGFVTGGGWIDSPAGASVLFPDAVGRANFGFVSKYERGAKIPSGQTQFQFKAGNLNFHSTVYEWLTVSGARAQYKGEGTINNGPTQYGFMLTAVDGQVNGGRSVDQFRIKIWVKGNEANVVYDNQMGAGNDDALTTAIAGGNIVIQTTK